MDRHIQYWRTVLAESTSLEKLEYMSAIGDAPENEDVLTFHSLLLLHHLAALRQLNVYHRAVPWKLLGFLDATSWDMLLGEMEEEWAFVLAVCDTLDSKQSLYHDMAVTRHQCYRDMMTKAEHLPIWFSHEFISAVLFLTFGPPAKNKLLIYIVLSILHSMGQHLRHFKFDPSRMVQRILSSSRRVWRQCVAFRGQLQIRFWAPCLASWHSIRCGTLPEGIPNKNGRALQQCTAWHGNQQSNMDSAASPLSWRMRIGPRPLEKEQWRVASTAAFEQQPAKWGFHARVSQSTEPTGSTPNPMSSPCAWTCCQHLAKCTSKAWVKRAIERLRSWTCTPSCGFRSSSILALLYDRKVKAKIQLLHAWWFEEAPTLCSAFKLRLQRSGTRWTLQRHPSMTRSWWKLTVTRLPFASPLSTISWFGRGHQDGCHWLATWQITRSFRSVLRCSRLRVQKCACRGMRGSITATEWNFSFGISTGMRPTSTRPLLSYQRQSARRERPQRKIRSWTISVALCFCLLVSESLAGTMLLVLRTLFTGLSNQRPEMDTTKGVKENQTVFLHREPDPLFPKIILFPQDPAWPCCFVSLG